MEKLEWWIYPLLSLFLSFSVFVGGQSNTCYYPFLLSHKFYIIVKNPKLQKILISDQLNRSKSTQTRPEDRNKMAVLGIIHYVIQIPIHAVLNVMILWLIVSKVIGLEFDMIFVKAKLFCPEIAGLFCRIAGLFCHDSRANLSLKPVCFGIAIS